MRWFLDTEFDENGTTIKLISVALVSEYGHYYYRALHDGWDPNECNEWVRKNVLPSIDKLYPWDWEWREKAAEDIKNQLLSQGDGAPEIWGYFCDYDWVALCQLFGTMMDLPKGFPMYCLDLKQEMHRLGITKDNLPPQPDNAHDALADARWIREAWLCIRSMESKA